MAPREKKSTRSKSNSATPTGIDRRCVRSVGILIAVLFCVVVAYFALRPVNVQRTRQKPSRGVEQKKPQSDLAKELGLSPNDLVGLERLTENLHKEFPLHQAAEAGNLDEVEKLLRAGSPKDLEEENILGESVLAVAAHAGHLAIVQRLLTAGANVAAVDDDRQTPLHAAAQGGHIETVTALLASGASAAATDVLLWTPLHLAVAEGHTELAAVLLASETSVDSALERRTKEGSSVLHLSAARGHVKTMEWLLAQCPKELVRAENSNFMPPLQFAVQAGHSECVRVLIGAGAVRHSSKGVESSAWLGAANITEDERDAVVKQLGGRVGNGEM